MTQHRVRIGAVEFGNALPLAFIAGPCAVESYTHAINMAAQLDAFVPSGRLVFKASFDKANRTSANAPRGAGLDEAVSAFRVIRRDIGLPVITDVHTVEQCAVLADEVDALQIPAMLQRQTDLIVAAARTGRPVLIKKSQASSPSEMRDAALKAMPGKVLLGERGARFGYGDLVVDMRGLQVMKQTGLPVVFDATHSLQRSVAGRTGGAREYLLTLARAAVAVGIAGLFFEAHDNPAAAISDGDTQVNVNDVPELLWHATVIDDATKELAA